MTYRKGIYVSMLIACLVTATPACQKRSAPDSSPAVTRLAFGSCAHHDKPQPVYDVVLRYAPDFFVFLGDNIYGDSYEPDTLRERYARLAAKPEFLRLVSKTKVLATWDDHDYGWNDAGRHYPLKETSKSIFLDFWNEPADSPRRVHPGIFTAYQYRYGDRILQIILLDNRTFRDNLLRYEDGVSPPHPFDYTPDYLAHTTADSTLLGEMQWQWLEEVLQEPADVRIIASGTQFGISYNGYEAWANFPHEQQRMLDLIRSTRANGVLFITGDVHYGEISVVRTEGWYPVYDVTASGITETWDFATPNTNRIAGPVMENHFGLVSITWMEDPVIQMAIIDVAGNERLRHTIRLSDIGF